MCRGAGWKSRGGGGGGGGKTPCLGVVAERSVVADDGISSVNAVDTNLSETIFICKKGYLLEPDEIESAEDQCKEMSSAPLAIAPKEIIQLVFNLDAGIAYSVLYRDGKAKRVIRYANLVHQTGTHFLSFRPLQVLSPSFNRYCWYAPIPVT